MVRLMSERRHFVRGSKRQHGYYRRVPYHYELPSENMRKARLILTETAFTKGRDKIGIVKVEDGEGNVKSIPASAKVVKDAMQGIKIAPTEEVVTPEVSPVERLRKFIEILSSVGT